MFCRKRIGVTPDTPEFQAFLTDAVAKENLTLPPLQYFQVKFFAEYLPPKGSYLIISLIFMQLKSDLLNKNTKISTLK